MQSGFRINIAVGTELHFKSEPIYKLRIMANVHNTLELLFYQSRVQKKKNKKYFKGRKKKKKP